MGDRNPVPHGAPMVVEEEEEEEEEEGLFKADAVNEEDPERDRATQEESLFIGGGFIDCL